MFIPHFFACAVCLFFPLVVLPKHCLCYSSRSCASSQNQSPFCKSNANRTFIIKLFITAPFRHESPTYKWLMCVQHLVSNHGETAIRICSAKPKPTSQDPIFVEECLVSRWTASVTKICSSNWISPQTLEPTSNCGDFTLWLEGIIWFYPIVLMIQYQVLSTTHFKTIPSNGTLSRN